MSNIMFFIIMIALFLISAIIAGHGDSEHVQLDAKLNDLVPLDGSLLPFCWRLSTNTFKLCQHRYEEENTNAKG